MDPMYGTLVLRRDWLLTVEIFFSGTNQIGSIISRSLDWHRSQQGTKEGGHISLCTTEDVALPMSALQWAASSIAPLERSSERIRQENGGIFHRHEQAGGAADVR
jgi:hypothetical protein